MRRILAALIICFLGVSLANAQQDEYDFFAITGSSGNAKGTSQSIKVYKEFETSQTLEAVMPKGEIGALYISNGSITLHTPSSYARVLAVDEDGAVYPIFKSDYVYFGPGSWEIADFCAETCVVENKIIKEIKIELLDALLRIDNINYDTSSSSMKSFQEIKDMQVQADVNAINNKISQLGLQWEARVTSIAQMPWNDKLREFSGSGHCLLP